MKKRFCLLLAFAALCSLLLGGCSSRELPPSGNVGDDVPVPAAPEAGETPAAQTGSSGHEDADTVGWENGGLQLRIPPEYEELLVIEAPQDDAAGTLFTVSEKASVEAAQASSDDSDGAGWLFSVGWVDKEGLRELLISDYPGAEVFARDEAGRFFVYYHPTDVRFVRESTEAMLRDQEQWSMLNEWAWDSVRDAFVRDNASLEAFALGHSQVERVLARIALFPDTEYIIGTLETGPMDPNGFDASPYALRLLDGAVYEWAERSETPDGEYIVLSIPEEGYRFDFFLGGENYVREVWQDEMETLYKVSLADGLSTSTAVMEEWYRALAAHNGVPVQG